MQKLLITTLVIMTSLLNPVVQAVASVGDGKKSKTQVGNTSTSGNKPPKREIWIASKAERANRLSKRLDLNHHYEELLSLARNLSTERQYELKDASATDLTQLTHAFGCINTPENNIDSEGAVEAILNIMAMAVVSGQVQLTRTSACSVESLAMMADGFSGVDGCKAALQVIADEVIMRQEQLSEVTDWTTQHLAMVVGGFSGVSGCETALQVIADEVVRRQAQLSQGNDLKMQSLAMMANGFSGVSGCETALQVIADEIFRCQKPGTI